MVSLETEWATSLPGWLCLPAAVLPKVCSLKGHCLENTFKPSNRGRVNLGITLNNNDNMLCDSQPV